MKKSILLLPVLFFMLFSCNDATDIIQENELPGEEAYVTLNHLRSGLNGAYSAYGPDFGGDAIAFNDLFTDNMRRGPQNNGQGSEEYNFLIQPNSDLPSVMWSNRYSTINRINRVLEAYDRLYDGFDSTEKRVADHIKGNLLALRALCHLDLFQYFTVDYKNASSPSVIKMDFVPENAFQVFPRNTVSEILTFIKDDLAQANTILQTGLVLVPGEEVLPTGITGLNTVFYLRPVAVNFMQSKVALLEGDYTTAQTIASTLLTSVPMSPKNVYPQMFTDANPGESIFKLSRVGGNNSLPNLFYFNSSTAGPIDPYLNASRQLYDLYPANDIRRTVIFGATVSQENLGNNNFPIRKYTGSSDGPTINDVKLFRSSELKLIIAECKARNNDLAGAALDVQQLRLVRVLSPVPAIPSYANLNAALTDILLERRKEFAFEGHRYLDLKRIGTEINVGISRLADDAFTFNAPTSLAAGDYRFTMPIPTSEISANPTIIQNPNY